MGEISRKEFETYLRIKEFIERNGYDEADLMKVVRDRKPTRTPLIIRFDDMEPKKYERLSDAANDIKVSKQTLIYAYEDRSPGGGAHKDFFDRDARPRTNFNYPKK